MSFRAPHIADSIHPTEAFARIDPLPMETMGQDWLNILGRIPGEGLKGAGLPRNALGSIMHSPDTFGPFLNYWVSTKSLMSLSGREQALVILRMACLYLSDYLWKHHVPVGREFGINDQELTSLHAGHWEDFASPRERSLLALTDELVNERTIRPTAWMVCKGALDDKAVVDLIALVSQYVFFALMNNALQVQLEPALDGIPGLADLDARGPRQPRDSQGDFTLRSRKESARATRPE